jgi:phosphatidylglycerol:prolipoprotein diacylglycerol transferase
MYPFIGLTQSIQLPTYILVISLTYSLSILYLYWRAGRSGKSQLITLDFSLMIMLGGFVGARLTHILYENLDYYLNNPLDVFKIWQGGFVFFGGFIGAFLATYIFARLKNENFFLWADFFTPVFPVGYALGRLGCFLNGCCFGELCNLPWAVEFTHPGLPGGARHPTQLYASAWELLVSLPVALIASRLARTKRPDTHGLVFISWVLVHSVGRILMEIYRADLRGPMLLGLSLATWMSFIFIFLSSWYLLKAKRLPGARSQVTGHKSQ